MYHGPLANGEFNRPSSLRYDALASGAAGTDKARREHIASQCQASQARRIYTGAKNTSELYIL